MGKSTRESRDVRVALRFHLPFSNLHLNYQQMKMKSFIILICVGMAIAGDDLFGLEKMKKQWTEYKAMESCFGEDMMKTSMLKMKGRSKVHWNGHARTRSSNVQISPQSCSCIT